MTAIATLPVLLAVGIHSARPAASAVGTGALYSCTTHNLIYQTNGSAWSTWATVSGGLADPMTTRGDMIVRNASNVTDRLGIGSAGKVLSSDGTDISWQTPGGGGSVTWSQRYTGNNSSPNINITGLISSTYDVYLFEFCDILPATNNVDWEMRTSTDGGANYDAGGSDYTTAGFRWHSGVASALNGGAVGFILCSGGDHIANNSSWKGVSGWAKLYNPLGSGYKKVQGYATHADQTLAVFEATTFVGVRTQTTAVDAVRFLLSSGNIVSGTVDVYGLKHA